MDRPVHRARTPKPLRRSHNITKSIANGRTSKGKNNTFEKTANPRAVADQCSRMGSHEAHKCAMRRCHQPCHHNQAHQWHEAHSTTRALPTSRVTAIRAITYQRTKIDSQDNPKFHRCALRLRRSHNRVTTVRAIIYQRARIDSQENHKLHICRMYRSHSPTRVRPTMSTIAILFLSRPTLTTLLM